MTQSHDNSWPPSAIALMNAYERDVDGSARRRRAAECAWPAVAATQRLAYRTLNACWAMEEAQRF